MNRSFIILFLSFFVFGFNSHQRLKVEFAGQTQTHSVAELVKKVKPKVIEVVSPYTKEIRSYEGFPLNELLASLGLTKENTKDVIFECADKYKPIRSLQELQKMDFVLAFRQVGGKVGRDGWQKIGAGKKSVNPGPFYLVSSNAKTYDEFPWPYQVIGLTAVKP